MAAPVQATRPVTPARPSWSSIPGSLRDAVTARTGPVAHAETPSGGFTAGFAALLRLADADRVFVKALPTDHPMAASYRHEAASADCLPRGLPAPVLRWHTESDGWIILGFDAIEGQHPRIAPPAPDLPAVLQAITAAQLPALTLPGYGGRIGPWLGGWAEIAAAPPDGLGSWVTAHLADFAAAETTWLPAAAGTTVVHGDVRADNMLIDRAGQVMLVDWAFASRGAPWLDLADLIMQMILAGHTPADAEQRLAHMPAWQDAAPGAVTSYAIASAGYWTRSAQEPTPTDSPYLRAYQAAAARAAAEWITWRWDRHPPR